MNGIGIPESARTKKAEFLEVLNELHLRSGLSLREVAQDCDLDPSYVHYILKGTRRPQRDVIIALGFTYGLDRLEVDEILLLTGFPPIGRGSLRGDRDINATIKID